MDRPRSPLRPGFKLRLAVADAIRRPGWPLPIHGTLANPGDKHGRPVAGFLDHDPASGFHLSLTIAGPDPEPAKPRGRPNDDGRRVAVWLAFDWLTDGRERLNKTQAYDRIARELGYSDAREVRRVVNDKRTKRAIEGPPSFTLRSSGNPQGNEQLSSFIATIEGFSGPDEAWRYLESLAVGHSFKIVMNGWGWRHGDERAQFGRWTLAGTIQGE